MAYKVVKSFFDKEDNSYLYKVEDPYPRTGTNPSQERNEELSTTNNDEGKIFIKKAKKRKGKS